MKVANESWAHAVGAKLRYCGRMIDAGPIVDAASFGADLRKRISMRRRCWTLSGNPEIASVSSVFTSCAPDNGINLYPASNALWRKTLTTATARASPSPALSTGIRLPMLAVFLRTDADRDRDWSTAAADRPLVGVADHLDDVDVVFLDVFENLERRLIDQRVVEGRRQFSTSGFEVIAVGLAHPDDRRPLMAARSGRGLAARDGIEDRLRCDRRFPRFCHCAVNGGNQIGIANGLVGIDAAGAKGGGIGDAFAKLSDRHAAFLDLADNSAAVDQFTPVLVDRLRIAQTREALEFFGEISTFLQASRRRRGYARFADLLFKLLLGGDAPGLFALQKCRHRDQKAKHQQDHDLGHGQAEHQAALVGRALLDYLSVSFSCPNSLIRVHRSRLVGAGAPADGASPRHGFPAAAG